MTIDSAFLDSIASLFPGGHNSPWYVYAALVFQANDRMDLVAQTWTYIASRTPEEETQLFKARKLREALLKASVLVGFPKGINALLSLREGIKHTTPHLVKSLDTDTSLRQSLQRKDKDARGLAFFTEIYAKHTDRVLQTMSLASGGDLSEFAINAVYGDLMAETSRLDAKETGLLEFLACYAVGGSSWSQAKGHMFGARNLGNGRGEVRGVIGICRAIEGKLEIVVTRREGEWDWLAKADEW